MKKKLYFASKHDEICYNLEYFKDLMEFEGYDEMTLFEAKKQEADGVFWCKEFSVIGEKDGFTCGKFCEKYKPRNGKSGICKHYSLNFYEPSDITLILKK